MPISAPVGKVTTSGAGATARLSPLRPKRGASDPRRAPERHRTSRV